MGYPTPGTSTHPTMRVRAKGISNSATLTAVIVNAWCQGNRRDAGLQVVAVRMERNASCAGPVYSDHTQERVRSEPPPAHTRQPLRSPRGTSARVRAGGGAPIFSECNGVRCSNASRCLAVPGAVVPVGVRAPASGRIQRRPLRRARVHHHAPAGRVCLHAPLLAGGLLLRATPSGPFHLAALSHRVAAAWSPSAGGCVSRGSHHSCMVCPPRRRGAQTLQVERPGTTQAPLRAGAFQTAGHPRNPNGRSTTRTGATPRAPGNHGASQYQETPAATPARQGDAPKRAGAT